MSETPKTSSELVDTIRLESATLADWAEIGGAGSVEADQVRERLMAAAESLEEQLEATDKLLREIQRALWHAGFGRGRSELDGLFAALGAELGPYPASEPKEDA